MFYILRLDVLLMYIIYRHHFCLNLVFSYFLYSLTLLFFLKHVVSPIQLRLHVTQEVPLPSCIFNRFCHIGDNVRLVGGELRKEVLLLMLSYFGNLVAFCLIFKFFKFFILLSMVIKEKF